MELEREPVTSSSHNLWESMYRKALTPVQSLPYQSQQRL